MRGRLRVKRHSIQERANDKLTIDRENNTWVCDVRQFNQHCADLFLLELCKTVTDAHVSDTPTIIIAKGEERMNNFFTMVVLESK